MQTHTHTVALSEKHCLQSRHCFGVLNTHLTLRHRVALKPDVGERKTQEQTLELALSQLVS